MRNRPDTEQIAAVLPIVVDQYPFYAPMIFTRYTLGLRYYHIAAMWWNMLSSDGGIATEDYAGDPGARSARRAAYKNSPTHRFSPYATDNSGGQRMIYYWPF